MPELPEVETTRRGLSPHVLGRRVRRLIVRDPRLRWPVPEGLSERLAGKLVSALGRRGKYLLFTIGEGTLLVHLGMSGSLSLVPNRRPAGPHDHVDLVLDDGITLRLNDPRRFGSLHWTEADPLRHPLLKDLGPEPLTDAFSSKTLYARSRGRRLAVKAFLMDSHTVVGVGNIYASESLFLAGIHPQRAAGRIGRDRYKKLENAVREVLGAALEAGGTTLRDFVGGDGKPGYFQQTLSVYGRDGEPCKRCPGTVRRIRQGQRTSYFCPGCQR